MEILVLSGQMRREFLERFSRLVSTFMKEIFLWFYTLSNTVSWTTYQVLDISYIVVQIVKDLLFLCWLCTRILTGDICTV